MAKRRMLSSDVIGTDAFLRMPLSTQALYMHLNQAGDDDGFVSNPEAICRTIGANYDDLNLLIAKSFVIRFESGVAVIKHWLINNYLQNDRYNPTRYILEKAQLFVKKNKAYTLDRYQGVPLVKPTEETKKVEKNDDVYSLYTQHNITEHNITQHNLLKSDKSDKSDKAIFQNGEGLGFVKELIKKRIIEEDDIHISEYQEFFDDLYDEYPDKAMIGLVIGYVSSYVKNNHIDNLYGYLTVAIRDGMEKVNKGYTDLESALSDVYKNMTMEEVSHVA